MPDSPLDLDKLQGSWSGAWEVGGHQISAAWMTVAGDRASRSGGAEERFTIDPTREPRQIDFYAGDTCVCRGIYSLDGDLLTLLLGPHGGGRPLDWNSDGSFVQMSRCR